MVSLSSIRKYWPFYIILVLSITLILFFLFDWLPALRGGYGWRWPYIRPESDKLLRILPAVLATALYLFGVRKLRKTNAIYTIIWCVLGALFIPVTMLYWWGDPLELLFTRTVSGLITGGFSTAAKMESVGETLQQWPSLMPALKPESIHIALSLPGWPVAFYGVTRLLEAFPLLSEPMGMGLRPFLCNNVPVMNLSNAQLASAWLGIAAPLWAALTIVPLYFLGRAAADESVARKAVAWWPLVPSLTIFMGTLNTPTPLIATTMFYVLWTGLTRKQVGVNWRLILAGALTAVSVSLSFAFIPLLLFAGLLALLTWQRDKDNSWLLELRKPVIAGIQFGIGLLLPFAVYTIAAGHTPFEVLNNSLLLHFELKRAYWPWLWLHSWDFIIFVGLPALGLFVMGMTRWGRPRMRQLAIALGLTLLIIVLSGTARGETGRLWLYFMPLVILVAAGILVQLPRHLRYSFVASQVIWLFVLFAVLPAVGRGYAAPPSYEDIAFEPGDGKVIPAEINFAEMLQLDGYSAEYDASAHSLVVDLHWHPQQQLAVPYFFSALLVAPDGAVMPATNWQPFDYQYPTTCWQDNGTPLIDRIRLPLQEEFKAGEYWLSLSIFQLDQEEEMARLSVILPDGTEDTQVGLGPFTVK